MSIHTHIHTYNTSIPITALIPIQYMHPYLASAVIGAGDELVPRLVEGAVGERQDVRAQDFEKEEVAGVVALQALDQLVDHPEWYG